MKQDKTIVHGGIVLKGSHVYEVVKYIPEDYEVWNIGEFAPDGYLPLCKLLVPGDYKIDVDALKCIRTNHAKEILKVAEFGANTLEKIEMYLEKCKNSTPKDAYYEKLQALKIALPYIKELYEET